ncbi:hypothetical protein M7I_3209 [Glarea lozoyensis 74030]|uniref:Uncharacterized protein n=1 Tax=Glarea lozoyensis (strain ATCC 74030 / MF5533) TaxID=1104152 RepID=H0EKX5_GLAL7|nr:hypothetical protein M7I_3209 [Glarea lozoyensis 74030]
MLGRASRHDYVKEAAAIRVNLEAVQSSLTRFIYHLPRELIVEGKVEKETVTKTTLEDTHLLHTNEGPAARHEATNANGYSRHENTTRNPAGTQTVK